LPERYKKKGIKLEYYGNLEW